MDARLPGPRTEVVEEERESGALPVFGLGENDLGVGARAEQVAAQLFAVQEHRVRFTLVFGKGVDQLDDRVEIGLHGRAQPSFGIRHHCSSNSSGSQSIQRP